MVTIEQILDILKKSGADVNVQDISPQQTFESIGLDSLDMFNFFTEIDEKLGIDVPDEDFEKLDTLEKLKDYLDNKK